MPNNKRLIFRNNNPNDECYTQYDTVEELRIFKDKFKNKIIYCNCDDYRWSNFVKWFKDNFEVFGLKKLIATHYIEKRIIDAVAPKYYEYDGKTEVIRDLQDNGSFDSPECIKILKNVDIVVSNPPFSLIKQYYDILEKYKKDFIFIGPVTLIGRTNIKRFFDNTLQYIRLKNRMFMHNGNPLSVHNTGFYTSFAGVAERKHFEFSEFNSEKNKIMMVGRRNEKDNIKILYAVNCGYSKNIPNYEWLLVPITFIEKEIPSYMQFEIVCAGLLNGQATFVRLLIHNTHPDAICVPQPEIKPLF